jgi:hypothetical protein
VNTAMLTARRFAQGAKRRALRYLNSALHRAERLFLRRVSGPLEHIPVFIIGAPRTGSTLLYQVMTEYFDFGYLSNLHCRFKGSPALAEWLFRPLRWRKQSSFSSVHGVTPGWSAPSECGEFWYRFFRIRPQYVQRGEADPRQMRLLRASVQALGNVFGRPILFKNMNCALRLQPLADALPEALFIVTKRDIVDTAVSLLQTRKRVHGDYNTWWSMEPPAMESLQCLPPHEQVVEQIVQIYELIESQSRDLGTERFLVVGYEQFCENVHQTLSELDAFFARHAMTVRKRETKIPERFSRSTGSHADPELVEGVARYAHNHQRHR